MLCQALSNLKHLTALTLPTVANSQLLDTIATHLKLRSLDVSCSTNVTDYGLMSLIGDQSLSKDTLQQLYLDGTSVTTNGIMLLLANLPQLELLKSPSLERALDMIVNEKKKSEFNQNHCWKILGCFRYFAKHSNPLSQIGTFGSTQHFIGSMYDIEKLEQIVRLSTFAYWTD